MSPNDTIRLLILNDSQQEAERLISMLHNAGRPNRAQHVTNEDSLTKLLQEHAWDILIAHEKTQNLPPANALKCIRRLNKDVPVILLSDNHEDTQALTDGLKMGAADVVRLDEDQHLLLVISRELQNRAHRQDKRIADRRFRESERRAQSLLDSSRDAIAYVQDGLYLYANESFAELFGYEDKDDIDCMPIMDMVIDDDQPMLKDFLKDFTLKGLEAENTRVEFRGLCHDGKATQVALDVAHATFDDEPCIQFVAKASRMGIDEETAKQLESMKWKDVVSGLYNRGYMLEHLDKSINNLADGASLSLFYIDINDFAESVQAVLGIAGTDKAVVDLATLLKSTLADDEILARFGDSTFTLLTGKITAEKAQQRARDLCKKIEDHIVDVDGKTLQLTASIGISLVNENSTNAATVIEQAIDATEKARASEEESTLLYEPPISAEEKQEKNIKADVQNALDNDRFRLLFQPIISLRGSE
ncbi:MAG TPA: diguanylate cyclase, partial [Cellvibrionaceae bacterium]